MDTTSADYNPDYPATADASPAPAGGGGGGGAGFLDTLTGLATAGAGVLTALRQPGTPVAPPRPVASAAPAWLSNPMIWIGAAVVLFVGVLLLRKN